MAVSRRPNAIGRLCQVGAALLCSALVASAQAQPNPSAGHWLPDGAVYAFEVSHPAALLDLASNLGLTEMLPGNPTEQGFRTLIDTLGKRAGTDFKGLIRQFTGGGVTYALYPGDSYVWVFDAQNAIALDGLQQFVKAAAGTRVIANRGEPVPALGQQFVKAAAGSHVGVPLTMPASAKPATIFYQEYPGNVAAWSLDGKQFFARTGNRLVLVNRSETLKALFSPRTPGSHAAFAASLASSALYSQARHAVTLTGRDPDAWAFVNMAMLNQYPPTKKALATGSEPFDLILNGALKQSLRGSTWLAMGLNVSGKQLHVHAVTDGKLAATGAGAFTLPGDTGVLPNLQVPRELAAITLWRDLGQFYAQKETLFPEKTSGGILTENFMEIFFTGRDLNQEVFSRIQPQVRLVVARQQYDPRVGTPVEQYPAAALIFRVGQSADDFGEVLEEAWQKAVGLTNFTRGQQALPGVILDRQLYGGVPFTYGYFSARAEKDRTHLPSRFNMRPSIVRDGSYIILSTTDGLAKDLIDAVNKEDGRNPAPRSSAHTVIEVTERRAADNAKLSFPRSSAQTVIEVTERRAADDAKLSFPRSSAHTVIEVTSPAEIAALLNVNKIALVRQSVLSSGKKPEQAAREFDQNTAWLDKLDRARLSISATPDGQVADLDLQLKGNRKR